MSKIKKYLELLIPPIVSSLYTEIKKKNSQYKSTHIQKEYLANGQIPWSKGYNEYKISTITKNIEDKNLLHGFKNKEIPSGYGYRLDERVVEYPWLFSKLPDNEGKLMDAGSTFNFDFIVNQRVLENKNLTILTFAPENNCYYKKRISYVFDDLRNLPFRNELFDVVVSQSTIEHIDMDNSIYGYSYEHNENQKKKSYEYVKAIQEMLRVLKPKGMILLTFPFGKFENHGFFQQFDEEMLDRILKLFSIHGNYEIDFFKYENLGWRFAKKEELRNVFSYNPHNGMGKQDDNAAHCRSIACIKFIKI